MKHFLPLLFTVSLFLIACAGGESDTSEMNPEAFHESFFNTLLAECGSVYTAESTYPEDEAHPLVGTELRIEIIDCSERQVRMELIRNGDYWHGAWVVEMREEGLHLYHDHLGTVRTMDDLGEDDYHGYGGYADGSGNSLTQYFPADDITAEMIPAATTNVWMLSLVADENQLVYYLERGEIPRFRAVFTKR